jgi:hypothetical protein
MKPWILSVSTGFFVGLWLFMMLPSPTAKSNLDPPPPPYVWYRINPETNLTCLIVEAQYAQHPIAMWCERMAP